MNVDDYRGKVSDLLGNPDSLTAREAATRFVGVVLLVAVGYLHLMDISHKIEEGIWYMVFLFTGLMATSVALALALVRADGSKIRFVWVGAAALAAGAMFGYFVSRAIPLPGMGDHQGDWFNSLGIWAGLLELGLVGLAAFALRDRVLRRQAQPRSPRRTRVAAPALGVLALVLALPARVFGHGGEEMTPEEMEAAEMGHDPGAMDHESTAGLAHDPLLGGTELGIIVALALALVAWAGVSLRARVTPSHVRARPRPRRPSAPEKFPA